MLKLLKNKHLLLDTNVLIYSLKFIAEGCFNEFFNNLSKFNVKSVIDEYVRFEFLRSSRTKANLETKKNFLNSLLGGKTWQLPVTKEILDNANELALIYSNKNPDLSKRTSITDCMIAAQLMKYKNEIFLATTDNNDYPLFIFDRIEIITIDTMKDIINIGIYQFNQYNYNKCKADFNKT